MRSGTVSGFIPLLSDGHCYENLDFGSRFWPNPWAMVQPVRRMLWVGGAFLVMALFVPVPVHAESVSSRGRWTVQPGDVLGTLARRFHVSVDELKRWNELTSDRIRVGQTLVVQCPPELRASPSSTEEDQSARTTPSVDEGGEASAEGEGPRTQRYVVKRGDRLSRIAQSHGMTVEDIVSLNPGMSPNRLRVGQILRMRQGKYQVEYEVRRGDTLSSLAKQHDVSVRDLSRWNRHVNPNRIRSGQQLVIHTDRAPSHSESVGAPNRGVLRNAAQLPTHPGYVIRSRNKAWGTAETIHAIVDGADRVVARHGSSPRIRVHDISRRYGGSLDGHLSHQSGRDVDIAYYQRRCPNNVCMFVSVRPRDLDVRRQWTLFQHWLENDSVESIFVDYALQRPLYQFAQRNGATTQQLDRWFQYPRGKNVPAGVVRHFPKHHHHFHARFRCHSTDSECSPPLASH